MRSHLTTSPPRGQPFVLTSAESVAERVELSVMVLSRVTQLWRQLLGNLTMLDRCVTQQAHDECWLRVVELSEAIGLLLPRLQGEIGSAPFHLDALMMRDLHLRLIDVALRRVTVQDSSDVQALLDRLAYAGREGMAS